MNKPFVRLIAVISLTLFTASTAFAVSYSDLTSYQKQKYWQMMDEDKCYDLLMAKKYTAYRACALNVMDKASLAQESGAWCKNSDPASDTTPNFLVSGTVTSDLYPQGIKDYIYVSDSTSYMMKGFCINDANPRYAYYSKDCTEIGPKYYADTNLGVCVNGNHAPVVDTITDKSVNEGTNLQFTVSATDQDNDSLSYEIDSLPTGAFFDKNSGLFSFTPDFSTLTAAQKTKVISVKFKAYDGDVWTNWTTVNITISNVNQAPTITEVGDKTISEGSTLSFNLTGTDLDGDALTFSADALPTGVTLAANGAISFSPAYSYIAHPNPVSKVLTFNVKANDGTASSSFTSVNITVNDKNQTPTISTVPYQAATEGTTFTLNLDGADLDGDTITYSSVDLPAGVSLNQSKITFNPDYNYITHPNPVSKVLNFNVQVSDGSLSSSIPVKITVNDKNQLPTINSVAAQSVNEGANVQFTVSGADADSDALSYDYESLPAGATFDKATGIFSYSPDFTTVTTAQKTKVVSVKFKSFDGITWSALTQADITVSNVNLAPTLAAVADQVVTEGSTLTVNLKGNDPDADALTYSSADLPAGITLNASTGVISFSPDYTYIAHPNPVSKILNFNLQVSDGSLSSAIIPVKITVNDKNQAPVVTAMADQYAVAGVDTITFQLKATDLDGDAITGFDYTGSVPTGLTMNKTTGLVTYTPVPADAQKEFKIPFTATDGATVGAGTVIRVVATNDLTPGFGYEEQLGNPKDVLVGGMLTKYYYLYNYDPVRFITLKLEAVDHADYTKYIPPSWISFPEGIMVTLKPMEYKIVKVNMTVPVGTIKGLYTMVTRGKLVDFGGMKTCQSAICVSVAVGSKAPANIK